MDFLTLPPVVYFSKAKLKHYASFEYQIEDENPILLAKFIDCVSWGNVYPIRYDFDKQEFIGLFVPKWWDKLRGRRTQRIIFDEEGLFDNVMVEDTNFKPCKLSELKVGL